MQEDEFDNYKEALIEEKLERDHSLLDETDRHWEQIWDQRYHSTLSQNLVEHIHLEISCLHFIGGMRPFCYQCLYMAACFDSCTSFQVS